MRLTTWNVNGIRNPFSYQPWNTARTFSAMFDILESDIVVMQELKIQRKDLTDEMVLVEGWDCYFSLPKHKKGYSGVGIYTRNATCAPIRAEEGVLGVLPSPSGPTYRDLPENEHIGGYPSNSQLDDLGVDVDPVALDAEGRCVVVEFSAFVLFGVYAPANSNGLRDVFRLGFHSVLDCRIRNLIKQGKNVVLVGDLNVSRHEMDSAATLEEIRKNIATREDFLVGPNRRIFNQLLLEGEVLGQRDEGREKGVLWDTTRAFHPHRKGMYTHWETKVNARPGNYGSRIDFVLVAEAMQSWVKDANIQEGLLGSDHCPVYADFKDTVEFSGQQVHLSDVMSPPGHFVNGKRVVEWKIASTPAFSAKRMPEFDKRRTIKSMFAAPTLKRSRTGQSQAEAADAVPEPSPTAALHSATQSHTTSLGKAVGSGTFTGGLSQSTQSPSPVKRSAASPCMEPAVKRKKSDAKPALARGQQSLAGFFSAKNPSRPTKTQELINSDFTAEPSQDDGPQSATVNLDLSNPAPATPTSTTQARSPSPSPRRFASQLASAEQTQKSWGALFAKPVAPLCESHSEPCKTMQTKKKGSNQGRSFWMCARPLGPSGEKEKGTQWRCGTFIWCSDWQPRKDKDAGKGESLVK